MAVKSLKIGNAGVSEVMSCVTVQVQAKEPPPYLLKRQTSGSAAQCSSLSDFACLASVEQTESSISTITMTAVSMIACNSPLGGANSLRHDKEQLGSPPQWRPDAASGSCLCCGNDFSIWMRRHHCRACGELVCGACSPFSVRLPELGFKGRVRVCTHCHALAKSTLASSGSTNSLVGLESAAASSEFSDNEPPGDVDEELVFCAVEVLALTSRNKRFKVQYQYFVQSEAVSWLMDAGIMSNRTGCAALFLRLVDYGYVTLKPWNGSGRSAFYIVSEEVTLENRSSHYGTTIHSETSKCHNCTQSFQKALAPADDFCSIDCKTNALISESDSAHIRRFCN